MESVENKIALLEDPRVELAIQRTILALERTQLAWVRTSFAFIATGLALDQAVLLFQQAKLLEDVRIASASGWVPVSMTIVSTVLLAQSTFSYLAQARALSIASVTQLQVPWSVLVASVFVLLFGIAMSFFLVFN